MHPTNKKGVSQKKQQHFAMTNNVHIRNKPEMLLESKRIASIY